MSASIKPTLDTANESRMAHTNNISVGKESDHVIRKRNNLEDYLENNDSLINISLLEIAPPLARLESELDDTGKDDPGVASAPYPGVDDGFFTLDNPTEEGNPDVEFLPKPIDPEEIPALTPRSGSDDNPDEVDGPTGTNPNVPAEGPQWPDFNGPNYPEKPVSSPYPPGFGPDVEGGVAGSLPDINVYQHKKTLAQGMMDLALLSANANQLRYILESSRRHPYFYPSIAMVSISLILQIAVGVGLIWNSRYNVKDKREICIANKINNFTIIGIFLVTVINVFISAFGVADAPP